MRIKRWSAVGCVFVISILAGAGCHRNDRVETIEEAPELLSTVALNDSRAAGQLREGFYGLEANAWRWTAGKFSVVLKVPFGGSQKGAILRLKFAVPEGEIAKMRDLSVGATIGATVLPPEKYTTGGDHEYLRQIPVGALTVSTVRVDFTVDHPMPASSVDRRELGVVATLVALEPFRTTP